MSKINFSNAKNNLSLWFFLGIELVALLLAVGWLIQISIEKTFSKGPAFVYIESGLEAPIRPDLLDFNQQLSSRDRMNILTSDSKESGVRNFIGGQTDLLILSGPLTSSEVSRISAKRLPLKQQEIKLALANSPTKCYLIYDKQSPRKVKRFVNRVVQQHS